MNRKLVLIIIFNSSAFNLESKFRVDDSLWRDISRTKFSNLLTFVSNVWKPNFQINEINKDLITSIQILHKEENRLSSYSNIQNIHCIKTYRTVTTIQRCFVDLISSIFKLSYIIARNVTKPTFTCATCSKDIEHAQSILWCFSRCVFKSVGTQSLYIAL